MKTFLVIVAALSFVASLPAEPVSTLKPTGRVNDFAYAFDEASLAKLDAACREVDEKAHAQIVIVTVNSLDGTDMYDYSLSLFKQWGIGIRPANRGVLILLAIQDHRYRITVGSGLDPILKEGNVAGFGLDAVPLLRRGDYGNAALLMTSRVAHVIASDAGVTLNSFDSPPAQSSPYAYPEAQPVTRTGSDSSNVARMFVVICFVFAIPVYLLIQRGKRRLADRGIRITPDPNADIYVGSRPVTIFPNPAITASLWNSANLARAVLPVSGAAIAR